MSRALNDLSPQFRPIACEWIARCIERGVPVMIIDTLRTVAEHEANLKKGTSAAAVSNHLPRQLRVPGLSPDHPAWNKSDAIDLCPFEIWQIHGAQKLMWDPKDPVWTILGEEAERLGLRWGGRFKKPFDPGHGELPRAVWQ